MTHFKSHAEPCPHCGQPMYWVKESIVKAIQRWVHEYGRLPIANEWKQAPPGYPSQVHVRRFFGTWNAAIEAAGFEPRPWGSQMGKPGQRLGRDRQMVAGGGTGAKRHGPGGGYV